MDIAHEWTIKYINKHIIKACCALYDRLKKVMF